MEVEGTVSAWQHLKILNKGKPTEVQSGDHRNWASLEGNMAKESARGKSDTSLHRAFSNICNCGLRPHLLNYSCCRRPRLSFYFRYPLPYASNR
jgi:hypothetical protein